MLALPAYIQAAAYCAYGRMRRIRAEQGQGTVEYVGLILLVSLLMVGMVASLKGFNGAQGKELADVLVSKLRQAVSKITFR